MGCSLYDEVLKKEKDMHKFLLYLILLPTSIAFASSDHLHSHDKHKDINIAYKEVNQDKYNVFVEDLSNVNIAIIDVTGMVCDFCARGIEKTFYDDKEVKKVDVDLSTGKVLVAYSNTKQIDIGEIKNIFLSNGQTATNIIIKEL